ncbi:hypothetical protein [Microtetraspora malaysiensis]|uniref:DUF4190 domain-containing protein n=1 Tax=Microtetraspora malaysiensis TaxID=161358 RepID=UPI003D90083A
MTTPDKPAGEPQRDQRPDNETRPDEQRLVLPVNSWDEPDLEGSWWEPSGYREPDPVRPGENRSAFRETADDPARTEHRPPADPLGRDMSDRRERGDLSRRGAEAGEPDFSEWTDCGFSDDLAATDPGYRSWAEPETTWERLKAWAAQDPLANEPPYAPPAPQHPGAAGPDTSDATGQRDHAGNGASPADAGAYGEAAAGQGAHAGPEAAYGTPEARYGTGPEAHGYGAHGRHEAAPYGTHGVPEAAGYGPDSGHEAAAYGAFGGPEALEQPSLPSTAVPSQVPPPHVAQPPQAPPYAAPGAPQTSPSPAGSAQMPPQIPSQSGPPGRPGGPYDEQPSGAPGGWNDPYMDSRYGMSADASGLPRVGADGSAEPSTAYPADMSTPPTGWGLPPASRYLSQNPDPAATPVPPSAPPSGAAPVERAVCEHCGMPQGGTGSPRPGTGAFAAQESGDAGTGIFGAADVTTGPMERLGVPGGQSAQDRPVWSARSSPGEPYASEGAATGGVPAAGHVQALKAENPAELPIWGQDDDYIRIIGKDSGTEGPEEPQGRPGEYGERFPTPPRHPEGREPSEGFGDRTPPAGSGQPPFGDRPVHPGEPGRHGGAAYQQPPRRRGEGLGTAAMVLGIVSIVLLFFCGVGTLTAVAGIVLGVVALAVGSPKGRAITGIVLSVLTLVLAAVIGVMFYNWFQTNKLGECFDVRTHPTQASTQRCIEEKLSGLGLTR